MSYDVASIPLFDKQAKRLAKKYPSLKNDLAVLGAQLSEDPTVEIPLGGNCFKIKMAIASKGKGKSAGAGVITHFYTAEGIVFSLSIYDKSEQIDISNSEIADLLAYIEE